MKLKAIAFLLCAFIVQYNTYAQNIMPGNSQVQTKPKKKKLIKILSIDGGGIRGIIPALILQHIESLLKRKQHLAHCFHVMSGTSTGGIIVLLLNTPDGRGLPKFNATSIVSFYRNFGSSIFYQSWGKYITSFNGWLDEKYSSENLEKYVHEMFGNCNLRDAFTNIIIPAYEISEDDTVFFKSSKAFYNEARNFYFRDIARATSAAPTFFKPVTIQDINKHKTYTMIDGGVAANNPTMSACVHAVQLYGKNNEFLVVSIGTGTNKGVGAGKLSFLDKEMGNGGKIEWAPDIVTVMMHSVSDVVDYQMSELFVKDDGATNYYRFQPYLDSKHTEMDNTTPENIRALEQYAYDLIEKNQDKLQKIADLLDQD